MFGIGKPKDVHLEFYEKSKVSFIFSFKSQSLTIAQVDEVFRDLNKLLSTEIRTHLIHGRLSNEPEKIVDTRASSSCFHHRIRFWWGIRIIIVARLTI